MWLKLGLLLSGFFFAGLLPYSLRQALKHVTIDLNMRTLSYLSNKRLYGTESLKAYKWMLFGMALSTLIFFRLLIEYYDLHSFENLLSYADYVALFLICLAFIPHNIQPISIHHLKKSFQRILHNMLAFLVFILLPMLIITFQLKLLPDSPLLGISGLIIICSVVLLTLWAIIVHGLNGISELILINGISIWSLYVTVITFLF